MIRVLSFIRRYGWLLLVGTTAITLFVVALVFRRKPPNSLPLGAVLKTELAGVRAEGELERRLADKGRDAALAEVERSYEAQKHEMAESERTEAEELRKDPVRLAGILARAGARRKFKP